MNNVTHPDMYKSDSSVDFSIPTSLDIAKDFKQRTIDSIYADLHRKISLIEEMKISMKITAEEAVNEIKAVRKAARECETAIEATMSAEENRFM